MEQVRLTAADRERRQEIRREMKRLRSEMADEERQRLNHAIRNQLLDPRNGVLPAENPPAADSVVYCYVSCRGEADTRAFLQILWERQLPVALPRVEGKRMRFYLVHGKDELRPGYMEIAEPGPDSSPALGRPGPVVTPGLAFGRDGSRIGYGGGYYDRFFAEEPDHLRIAIAYPFQVLETLPCEDWDRKMDRILTGETVISSRSLCPRYDKQICAAVAARHHA